MSSKLLGLTLLSALIALRTPAQVVVLSGIEDATYFKIANDIREFIPETIVEKSRGSVDNYQSITQRDDVDFAFMQQDFLLFQSLKEQEAGQGQLDEIRVALSLGLEAVHILVRADGRIHSLRDLRRKTVAIGTPLEGSHVTASVMRRLTGIGWEESHISLAPALQALVAKEVDAVFFVGAAPIKALAELPQEIQANIALLPVQADVLLQDFNLDGQPVKVYESMTLPAGTYPWQTQPVPTLGVRMLLTTSTYDDENRRPARVSFLQAIANQQAQLTHRPNWNNGQFDFQNVAFPVYPPAQTIFAQE